jgi:hypothetical protein
VVVHQYAGDPWVIMWHPRHGAHEESLWKENLEEFVLSKAAREGKFGETANDLGFRGRENE